MDRDRFFAFVRFALLGASLATASPASAGGSGCGLVVGPGETVTLTSDIGPCDDTAAVTVNAGTLDLGGHTVSCEDLSPFDGIVPQGILITGNGSVVTNGIVTGCRNGLTLTVPGGHHVYAMTVIDDVTSAVWIRGDGSRLEEITTVGAGDAGFRIEGSRNRLSNLEATDGGRGFNVIGYRNRITDSRASGNNVRGFDLEGEYITLIGNTATENAKGIVVGGAWCKVMRNTVDLNTMVGIELGVPGKLVGNTVTNNGQSGILLETGEAAKVTIVKNTAIGNATSLTGFDIEESTAGCGDHRWRRNVFGTASDPCVQ